MAENKLLSPKQAFDAMFIFVESYYIRGKRTGCISSLLSDIQILDSDGKPADPAMWEDWMEAINIVLGKDNTNRNHAE